LSPDVSRETKQEQKSRPQKRFHPVHFIFTFGHSGPAKGAQAAKPGLPFAFGAKRRVASPPNRFQSLDSARLAAVLAASV
jgi:hypothetical protein